MNGQLNEVMPQQITPKAAFASFNTLDSLGPQEKTLLLDGKEITCVSTVLSPNELSFSYSLTGDIENSKQIRLTPNKKVEIPDEENNLFIELFWGVNESGLLVAIKSADDQPIPQAAA